MEGPASEEREAELERLERPQPPRLEERPAVYGSTEDEPEKHFIGWLVDVDPDLGDLGRAPRDLAARGLLALPGIEHVVDVLALRRRERRVGQQPPRLCRIVVRHRGLEVLARRKRLAQLPPEPAQQADAGLVHGPFLYSHDLGR